MKTSKEVDIWIANVTERQPREIALYFDECDLLDLTFDSESEFPRSTVQCEQKAAGTLMPDCRFCDEAKTDHGVFEETFGATTRLDEFNGKIVSAWDTDHGRIVVDHQMGGKITARYYPQERTR